MSEAGVREFAKGNEVAVRDTPRVRVESLKAETDGTPVLTVSVKDGREKLMGWFEGPLPSASEFEQLLGRHEAELARGFDRLLALDELELDLFEHQSHAALRVLRDMRGRALLADEVGLGKTIEAGIIAKEYFVRGLAQRMLVLTPASLTTQWHMELKEKLALSCHVFSPGDDWNDHERIIASLDMARRPEHAERLLSMAWDIVIVDEAHRLKNRHTQSWRLVDGLQKKYMLLLTATPIQNDLEELYNMMTLLQPGLLQTYRAFKREYVEERRSAKRADELRERIGQAIVRTTRAGAGLDGTRRIVHAVSVPLNAAERDFYERVLQFARTVFGTPETGKRPNPLPLILLLRQLCSSPEAVGRTLGTMARSDGLSPRQRETASELVRAATMLHGRSSKLSALVQWIQSAEEPAVVFTQFRATQEALGRMLTDRGIRVVMFHGDMDRQQKTDAVARFRREGGVLISTEAGSEGQNLQFCRIVINCDLPWNPMRVEQRIGRVHRLGQTRDVLIVNVLAPDTMEMYVFKLLDQKIKLFEQVIGELDVILTRDDSGELLPGAAFERALGTAFLEAVDDTDAQRRLDDIGGGAAAHLSRLTEVQRRNDHLLPKESVTGNDVKKGPGPTSATGGDGIPLTTNFMHPLCLDVRFAADVLAIRQDKGAHPQAVTFYELLDRLKFVNARTRPGNRRVVQHGHWTFFFRISYRTDETRETLHAVVVDPVTEEARLGKGLDPYVDVCLDAIVRAGAGPIGHRQSVKQPRSPLYVVGRLYDVARTFIAEYVTVTEGLEHIAEARARLRVDRERLDEFYEGLEEEALVPVVQRLRRMETERRQRQWMRFVIPDDGQAGTQEEDLSSVHRQLAEITEGLQDERRRRLEELAVKYSVRANVDLIGAARVTVPRIELTYKLLTPVRRDVVFYYDPLFGEFLDLDCEHCGRALESVHVGSEGEFLCGDCLSPGGELA